MAQELQIRDSEDRVKLRSPWAAALLPFITFGIYHIVWWFKINRELRDYGLSKGYDLGQNPTNSLLALFPGAFIIVPPIVSYYNGVKRIQGAARISGKEPVSGWLALVLYLVLAPVFWGYLQSSLNNVWRSEAGTLPGESLPPAPDELPQRIPTEQQQQQ